MPAYICGFEHRSGSPRLVVFNLTLARRETIHQLMRETSELRQRILSVQSSESGDDWLEPYQLDDADQPRLARILNRSIQELIDR